MEKTLIILKPDGIANGHTGTVVERLTRSGDKIVACKMVRLTEGQLRDHYSHIADKPFFPEVLDFMMSAPVIVFVLKGDDVVARIRHKLGATDPLEAENGTLRSEYGVDKMRNVAHASDSVESAEQEIARFFTTEELHG